MSGRPLILVVSCSKTRPKSIIKLISKSQKIKEITDNSGLITHSWLLDTKYYTAEVNLLGIETDIRLDQEYVNNIEALIIHMDSNSKTGLEDLKKWDFLDKDYNVDVKLLLANYCNEGTNVTKSQALEWCLTRGYEFVELYPTIEKPEQEDDIIPEKFGVDRVIEALQSHTWSNLEMKNTKNLKLAKKTKEDGKISNPLSPEHIDEFTDLFSQLQTMKDSLQGMPMTQRKQCAEQMVTAFWKAIGGEEEEILDV